VKLGLQINLIFSYDDAIPFSFFIFYYEKSWAQTPRSFFLLFSFNFSFYLHAP